MCVYVCVRNLCVLHIFRLVCVCVCVCVCVVLQVLSKNRWTVLYCTLLAKAESDADRERIEEEMAADPEKKAILKVLYTHTAHTHTHTHTLTHTHVLLCV